MSTPDLDDLHLKHNLSTIKTWGVMMAMRTLDQLLPCTNERVLVRTDFNVPLDDQGQILDDHRIRAALPTLRRILESGGSIILLSHLGRPDGKPQPKWSLRPIARRLQDLIRRPVLFVPEVVGPTAAAACHALKPGQILMLENVRFLPGEEHPDQDPSLAPTLASYGTAYVDDAFGCAHRAHTTITSLPLLFGKRAVAGDLLAQEVQALAKTLQHPKRPLIAILGGSKVSTKIGVLHALCRLSDHLCLGGVMAQTFLAAQGLSMGRAPVETSHFQAALDLLQEAQEHGCQVHLPLDFVCKLPDQATPCVLPVTSSGLPAQADPLDLGPQTVQEISRELAQAKTVFWNGPLGRYEEPPFDAGSLAIAHQLATVSAYSVIGGGDTVAVVERAGVATAMGHVSTGGGASLEFIELGTLPGIEVLSR